MFVLASTISGTSPVDIVGIVFGLLVIVAAALAVARASYIGAQLAGLRGDRDDLMKRVVLMGEEVSELRIELGKERNAREVLERVVTGKEQLDQIVDLLRQHDTNSAVQGEAIIAVLQDLRRP